MALKNKNCRFCGRKIEKGHRCWELDNNRGTTIDGDLSSRTKKTRANVFKPIEKKIIRSVKGTTGEKALFERLFIERGGRSEISGKRLLPVGHERWHWQFLHILPKGKYSRYRLNSRNIVLALPEEHEYQDLATKDPQWSWFFLLKEILKAEYYGTK